MRLRSVGFRSDEVEVAGGRVEFRCRRESSGVAGEIDSAQRVEIEAQLVGEGAVTQREGGAAEDNDAVCDPGATSGRESGWAFNAQPGRDRVRANPPAPVPQSPTRVKMDRMDDTVAGTGRTSLGVAGPDPEQTAGQLGRQSTNNLEAGYGRFVAQGVGVRRDE